MLQRQPFQKLHGDERMPVLLANVVNRADVGMVQGGRGLGFALKAGKRLRITGNLLGQELEGDEAMQPRVFRFVDDAHAATSELLDDAVVGDGLADHDLPIMESEYGRRDARGKSTKAWDNESLRVLAPKTIVDDTAVYRCGMFSCGVCFAPPFGSSAPGAADVVIALSGLSR